MPTYKVQHVARQEHANAIKRDGFKVRPHNECFAHVFGPGVYFGMRDDFDSEWFYASSGHSRSPHTSSVIEAVVTLDNPLVTTGGHVETIRAGLVMAMGGRSRTVKAIRAAAPELRERFHSQQDQYYPSEITLDRVKQAMTGRWSWFDFEEVMGYAARKAGFDGMVVNQTGPFLSNVGGSQVVVFHPTKQNIKITKIRPVQNKGREAREWA